ncbi:MAG: type 1 glutamine amidotransferase domain-containing protein [Rhodoferax sp.]
MATILVPIPATDFDPTETGVPWQVLAALGHRLVFATPDGAPGRADARMLTGQGLGLLAPMLRADANGRRAYEAMERSDAFRKPQRHQDIRGANFDVLLPAGGHAGGMRPYLESAMLQARVAEFFAQNKPVGAICHGVLLAARSQSGACRSVLWGKTTTALLQLQEMSAWAATCTWLGRYYRTYSESVESEVRRALARRCAPLRRRVRQTTGVQRPIAMNAAKALPEQVAPPRGAAQHTQWQA